VSAPAAARRSTVLHLLERAADTGSARFAEWPGSQWVGADEVLRRALACAGSLHRLGLSPGDGVLVALGNSIDFVAAFFGVMASGGVPVPVPWPARRGRHLERFRHIARQSGATIVIVASADDAADVLAGTDVRAVAVETLADGGAYRARSLASVAFVQYTSGSTGRPQPIMPTAENVMAQLALAAAAYEDDRESCCVTWVPTYHDMGLVTGVLRPLFSWHRSVLMEPELFVASPHEWLLAVTTVAATHTSAPNFGYELCVRKAPIDGLDLRSLRVARNAGEPVTATTVRRFTEKFTAVGFRPEAMCPSYGMAEAVLTVTTGDPRRGPDIVKVRRGSLERGRAEPAVAGSPETSMVSSGHPLPGTEVRIVDPAGKCLPEGRIGEIMISGPQVVRPRGVSNDHLHATGDVGFLWSGQLVVLGRQLEKVSIRGRTLYASEIERFVADAFPEVRPGRVAVVACGLDGPDGFELMAETSGAVTDERTLAREIRARVTREFGANPSAVTLCEPKTLPLTSSGKLDRRSLRNMIDGRVERGAIVSPPTPIVGRP
jgi:acyl-CoA synthetase (AMP-forming)/AMP-acid ligase II